MTWKDRRIKIKLVGTQAHDLIQIIFITVMMAMFETEDKITLACCLVAGASGVVLDLHAWYSLSWALAAVAVYGCFFTATARFAKRVEHMEKVCSKYRDADLDLELEK